MKELIPQLLIGSVVMIVHGYISFFVVAPAIMDSVNPTLECNETCWQNASAPMPLPGYLPLVGLIFIIFVIVFLVYYCFGSPINVIEK